jgi:cytochrome c oxidase cbb3-type subunit III
MPVFSEILKSAEIKILAGHVLSFSGKTKGSEQGATLFKENCAACHGDDGKGNRELGAPSLADAIWLYGSDEASIIRQIARPKHGVMPAWADRLPDETLKQLTIYVHSLGGGEKSSDNAPL